MIYLRWKFRFCLHSVAPCVVMLVLCVSKGFAGHWTVFSRLFKLRNWLWEAIKEYYKEIFEFWGCRERPRSGFVRIWIESLCKYGIPQNIYQLGHIRTTLSFLHCKRLIVPVSIYFFHVDFPILPRSEWRFGTEGESCGLLYCEQEADKKGKSENCENEK